MKRIINILVAVLFTVGSIVAQNKEIKNVILLIPDGTSLSVVSAARWYQRYNHPEMTKLHIDPYLCGTILTYSSNAPIGDSAPTTSCYVTGYPSRAASIAMYPPVDSLNDIIPMDPEKAYQPMMTVLEAARITQNKATGLVFTCEFPHATPADCSAHTYDRNRYDWIAPQMVHNKLDVVIGGGVSLLSANDRQFLQDEGYGVFLNDIAGYENYKGDRMWALFGETAMEHDIDRNPEKEPSLAEMTQTAIEKLSKNENGFFLMVEGSQVDWAAHANDAVTMITEMLAFDKACGVALDFAKANGETVVVVVPDHGNSGFSIGSNKCPGYFHLTKDELFGAVSKFKTSANKLVDILRNTEPADLQGVFDQLTGIALSDSDYTQILQCNDYKLSTLSAEERKKDSFLAKTVNGILDKNTCFGFTTNGHTGEEVFLAIYDPTPNRLTGHHTNIELNRYLRQTMGLKDSLESLTSTYFAKHTDVFANYAYTISINDKIPVLKITNKKNTLEIQPNTNIVKRNGKDIELNTVVVYVDKNNTFYLPRSLRDLLTDNK
ncbi:MAG: alkaline phosphatase [Candidatus Azobacteroides sp.]|nr:alkaline phosphatase [Candidatus Azobacteroides sp.]